MWRDALPSIPCFHPLPAVLEVGHCINWLISVFRELIWAANISFLCRVATASEWATGKKNTTWNVSYFMRDFFPMGTLNDRYIRQFFQTQFLRIFYAWTMLQLRLCWMSDNGFLFMRPVKPYIECQFMQNIYSTELPWNPGPDDTVENK